MRPPPPRDFRCFVASKSGHRPSTKRAGLGTLAESAIHTSSAMCSSRRVTEFTMHRLRVALVSALASHGWTLCTQVCNAAHRRALELSGHLGSPSDAKALPWSSSRCRRPGRATCSLWAANALRWPARATAPRRITACEPHKSSFHANRSSGCWQGPRTTMRLLRKLSDVAASTEAALMARLLSGPLRGDDRAADPTRDSHRLGRARLRRHLRAAPR